MRIAKFLDAVMSSKQMKHDKELAAWLDVTPAAISQYRSGARTMDNEKCIKVALELGIDPTKVIMATDLDKAERSGQRSLWEVFMSRTATAASVLAAIAVTNFLTPTSAEAAMARLSEGQVAGNTNYAYNRVCSNDLRSIRSPPVKFQTKSRPHA